MTKQVHPLERASRALDEAIEAIEEAKPDVPAYAVDACRFARCELKVTQKRIENMRKLLLSHTERT